MNRDISPLSKLKTLLPIIMGIIISLGGVFLTLAALNVLPHGLNVMSGKGGGIFAGIMIGIGLLSICYGLCRVRNQYTPVESLASTDPIKNTPLEDDTETSFCGEEDDTETSFCGEIETDLEEENSAPLTLAISPISNADQHILDRYALSSPPIELSDLIVSWLDPSATPSLARVSQYWKSYFEHKAQEAIIHKKLYSDVSAFRFNFESQIWKKRHLNLNLNLKLTSLWIECLAMIRYWGTVKAVLTENYNKQLSLIVDFHRPISLFVSVGKWTIPHAPSKAPAVVFNDILYSNLRLMSVQHQKRERGVLVCSKNRIAFSIHQIEPKDMWMYVEIVDDPRLQGIQSEILQYKKENNRIALEKLTSNLFTQNACLKFSLQVVKNIGIQILNNGLTVSLKTYREKEMSVNEIIENAGHHKLYKAEYVQPD